MNCESLAGKGGGASVTKESGYGWFDKVCCDSKEFRLAVWESCLQILLIIAYAFGLRKKTYLALENPEGLLIAFLYCMVSLNIFLSKKKKLLYCDFLDCKKAFDYVDRGVITEGVSSKIFNFFLRYTDNLFTFFYIKIVVRSERERAQSGRETSATIRHSAQQIVTDHGELNCTISTSYDYR